MSKLIPTTLRRRTEWQPTHISGCQLWLDAMDNRPESITFGTGTNVSEWKDKSGAGHILTNIDSNFPTYNNGIVVSGATGATLTGMTNSTFTTSMLNRSFFFVFTQTLNTYAQFVGVGAPAGTNVFNSSNRYRYAMGTGTIDIYGNGGSLSGSASSTYTFNTSSIVADIGSTTSPNIRWFGNGFARGTTATIPTMDATTGAGLQIGRIFAGGATSERFNGTIHEIVSFNSALSTADRQRIEGYLAWKWGLRTSLPSWHPHRYISIYNERTLWQPSGSQLWLDANDTSTIQYQSGSTSIVQQWNDKSGFGRNAIQTTPANRPTYDLATNRISFNATNNQFLNAGTELSIGTDAGIHIFTVARCTNTGDRGIVGKSYFGNVTNRDYRIDADVVGQNNPYYTSR